jgi:hypothetical protein
MNIYWNPFFLQTFISLLFKPILVYNSTGCIEMAIGRKKKALVHVAKSTLHLDEVTYRRILKGVAGVESSAELTAEGFGKVMDRFQEMGFKGLLPSPYQPVPRGRLIPLESPQGLELPTQNQLNFISYLREKLNWDEGHYHTFSQRIIKRAEPSTKREGQKIIIGLMAILRKRALRSDPSGQRERR